MINNIVIIKLTRFFDIIRYNNYNFFYDDLIYT